MTRIWNRLFHTSRKRDKLPIILFDEYISTSNNHLKESNTYGKHLVSTDRLSRAYRVFLQQQRKKHSHWKCIDPFVQTWYAEFEKVNQQVQVAEDYLNDQLKEMSRKLLAVSSPLKNYNRKSLKRIHQFISTFINEYDRNVIQDSESASLNEIAFQSYYDNLETKISKQVEDEDSDPELKACMRLVYRYEQQLVLHQHYIYSQFQLLKSIIQLVTSDTSDSLPSISQVILSRWRQKYNAHTTQLQYIQHNFQAHLSKCIPNKKDVTCAICLSLLKTPTTIASCQHTFCRSCLQHAYCTPCFRRSRTIHRLFKPSTPAISCSCQSLSSEGMIPLNKQGACPLCRARFDPKDCFVDMDLNKWIISHFIPEPDESSASLYSRMQRWSNKLTDNWLKQDQMMLLMARKSWII